MKLFKLPENAEFTNKKILLFLLPIFLEQVLIALMGIADSLMVARSEMGEIAAAGVDLVKRIDLVVKQVTVALSAGGSVVIAMYMGRKDKKNAGLAIKSCVLALLLVSIVLSVIMLIFKKGILHGMYGSVEKEIMNQAFSYFSVTVFSYPFMMLYYVSSAAYRAMGKSRMPMVASLVMMSINLILKYIFIFKLDMGVWGAGLSSLIAFGMVGIILIILLTGKNNPAQIPEPFKLYWNGGMVKNIFRIGIPNGIENALFQIGSLILQGLVSTLGINAINANGLAQNLSTMLYTVCTTFTLGILTFTGQSMGAGKPEEAAMYTKHILKINYVAVVIGYFIVMPLVRPAAMIFNFSPKATADGIKILYFYFTGMIFFYPLSFALPNALRGAGDTKFTMIVSVSTMFAMRIGIAYFFVLGMHYGVIGIWMAMICDWIMRGIIFVTRFKRGKWKNLQVI